MVGSSQGVLCFYPYSCIYDTSSGYILGGILFHDSNHRWHHGECIFVLAGIQTELMNYSCFVLVYFATVDIYPFGSLGLPKPIKKMSTG